MTNIIAFAAGAHPNIPSLGASAAILGLHGAYLAVSYLAGRSSEMSRQGLNFPIIMVLFNGCLTSNLQIIPINSLWLCKRCKSSLR